MEDYKEKELIKNARYVKNVADIEHKHSFKGKAQQNMFKWYLYYFIPLFVIVCLIEDISNFESPRLNMWKQMF